MANKARLSSADLAYVLRCERIKAKMLRKIGRAALAHKFNMSESCLSKYISDNTKPYDHKVVRPTSNSLPIGWGSIIK